uniref:BLOC-1-related complex subunit 5 n=1 Tax=Panagrellus redivivus TaxID=6233 RepID=A0A7E4ZVE4_PANRE
MAILKRRALSVKMPMACRADASVYVNDVKEGVLHSYIRHYRQWEAAVPQLRSVKSQLPSDIQQLIDDIGSSKQQTMNRATAEYQLSQALEKAENEVKRSLQMAQDVIFNFLQKHLTSTTSTSIDQNRRGQRQTKVTIPGSRGPRTLVLGSYDLPSSTRTSTSYITTMYFEKPQRKRRHM